MFGENIRFKHEANEHGRDFVVGDLHGQRIMLDVFIDKIGFDKDKDRMFSVGDLCDRGPKSFETMMLVDESWFYLVVGNHEQMFYHWVFNEFSSYGRAFSWNGGEWANYVDRPLIEDLAHKFEFVPRMRTVAKKDGGVVHIIHAELYNKGDVITDEDIEDPEKLKSLCTVERYDGGEFSFWGRTVFDPAYHFDFLEESPDRDSIMLQVMCNAAKFKTSLIISGHTIMKEPLQAGNLLNIDTGAYFKNNPLTIYDINSEVIHQVKKVNDEYILEEVEPILFICG